MTSCTEQSASIVMDRRAGRECWAISGKDAALVGEQIANSCRVAALAMARRAFAAGQHAACGVWSDASEATDDAIRRRFYSSSDGDPDACGPDKYRRANPNRCADTNISAADTGASGWLAYGAHVERYDRRAWRRHRAGDLHRQQALRRSL